MLHPLISTVVQRPDLVLAHVSAYAELLNQEAHAAGSQILKRGLAGILAVVCASIFVSLTGIAVMLGCILNQFHWALVVVPAVALVLTLITAMEARKPLPEDYFPELKSQIESDARALRVTA